MPQERRSLQMVDLHSQYLQIKSEIDNAINDVIQDSAFIGGKYVNQFQQNLSAFLGGDNVVTCGNGTDALQIALMALELSKGDEVIVPAFSFVAPAEAVALLGLTPVFADVDSQTFNITAETIEPLITSKTKVIIVVHLFGQMADMESIIALAQKHQIKIIEDAAQAFGASCIFNGEKKLAGTIGDIGCTSFFPSKNLACFGDGGAVFSNDEILAERIKMIANHGQKRKYTHEIVGINSRLDGIQAAILDVKLKYLPKYIRARQEAAKYYENRLAKLSWLEVPFENENSSHSYNQFTVKLNKGGNRSVLQTCLKEKGISTMVYYPKLISEQLAYQKFAKEDLPVSVSLRNSVLSLPIHTEMNDSQLDYICKALENYEVS